MKRTVTFLLCLLLILSFAACKSGEQPSPSKDTAPSGTLSGSAKADPAPDAGETGHILVVYFSATHNTESVARTIASATGGDLFELVPVHPYTSDDLSWTTSGSRVNREHDDESLRDVELTNTTVENWSSYTTVYIGYPIWWGIAAWPVNNFIKNNDFTGKTVIPFATSASSGLGDSANRLAQLAGTGNWLEGKRFSSGERKETVTAWVNGLKIKA